MSLTLAYLMLDGPGEPHRHLMDCAFTTFVSLIISWTLYRFKIHAWVAGVLSIAASVFILSLIAHPITRDAMVEDFGVWYVIAIVTSAALPLLAAWHFSVLRKKENNFRFEVRQK